MADSSWKPKPTEYLEALQQQNPWGRMGKVPEALAKQVRRPLADALWEAILSTPRYQVVLGPRRVGKTVAMYQTIDRLITHGIDPSRLWFLRLDHPLLMHYELGGWAKSLIRMFNGSAESPLYLFLDEVNYAKSWDKWLKTFYDEHWPVRVVATSSSTAALSNRTIESGIGRWTEQYLTPYSFSEYLSLAHGEPITSAGDLNFLTTLRSLGENPARMEGRHDALRQFLLVGGFPELLQSAASRDDLEGELLRSQQVLRSEAVQRVAGMDIPQAFDIKNPLILERLLYVLAGQMCGLVNISKLSTDLELARQTIHQYMRYLEQAYLIFTLPNYSANEESVQRKGRKVFFIDGAVRNAALQRGLAPMHDAREWGYLLENAVASHLHALALQSGGRLFHWRDGTDEVDFVYAESDQPLAFEVAKGEHSLSGLRAIQKRFPSLEGRCFLVSAESMVFEMPEDSQEGIGRIPLSSFLVVCGRQTIGAMRRRMGLSA